MKKYIFIFLCLFSIFDTQLFAQQADIKVSGTVLSEKRETVPGATIVVKGTQTGVTTSADGKFSLSVPPNAILIVSFIGFKSAEYPVNGKSNLEITLLEDVQLIEDVVIVGYGTQKKVNLTGAVSTIDVAKTLGSRPVPDLARGLQGTSPGLIISSSSGNIGTAPEIHIRGIQGSINAESKPLILLDNVEIPNMNSVNPSDIESISVLKDAASASIYGARGSWGVILLTSKKGTKGAIQVSYDNNFAWSSPVNTPEIAEGAEGAEFMLKLYRRTAPTQASFNILGAYYDDLSINRMKQWKQLYGNQNFSDELVEGRDFERRAGQTYFYRPWNVDEVFLNSASPQMKHNISISGGSEKTTYYASFGMMDQKGLVKIAPDPDRYTRYNGTMRLESKINDWFSVRGSIMNFSSNKEYPNFRLANAAAGANEYWFNIYRYPETYPYGTFNGLPLKNIRNELEQAHMNKTQVDQGRIQLGSTLTFMKGWSADLEYTYVINNSHSKIATSPISGIDSWTDPTLTKVFENYFPQEDYVSQTSSWTKRNVGKAYTTYNKEKNGHSLKLMAGGDIEYYYNDFQYSKAIGLMSPSKPELNLTYGTQSTNGYPSHWSTLGFFGRVNYVFRDKYLVEANIRQDGSSKFPEQHKWGTFPSFSLGYILSNEKFMDRTKELMHMSLLKVRGSWGSIGNNNVGNNSYLRTMTAGLSNWWISAKNPTMVGVYGNIAEDLTWETIETLDLGFNAKFFKNALDVEFDWYSRSTKDMVTTGVELPASLGAPASSRNFGVLVTKGWELALTYDKRFDNGLAFNVKGTISDEIGKITELANSEVSIQLGGNDTPNYQGKILGEIWGYTSDRLFKTEDFSGNNGVSNPTWIYNTNVPNQDVLNTSTAFHFGPGDVKYKDIDGNEVVNFGAGTNLNSGDMSVIGNSLPHFTYGLMTGLTYKGFDLSAFLQGVAKRDYWATGSLFIPGFTAGEAVYQNQLDYWSPEHTDAFYPAPSNPGSNNHNANWQPQTRYLLNMAYLRVKNVTIGYTIPKKLTQKAKINRIRVFASGENLFTIDNLDMTIDPEIQQNSVEGFNDAKSFGRTYPYFRTMSFGAQIDF